MVFTIAATSVKLPYAIVTPCTPSYSTATNDPTAQGGTLNTEKLASVHINFINLTMTSWSGHHFADMLNKGFQTSCNLKRSSHLFHVYGLIPQATHPQFLSLFGLLGTSHLKKARLLQDTESS